MDGNEVRRVRAAIAGGRGLGGNMKVSGGGK